MVSFSEMIGWNLKYNNLELCNVVRSQDMAHIWNDALSKSSCNECHLDCSWWKGHVEGVAWPPNLGHLSSMLLETSLFKEC